MRPSNLQLKRYVVTDITVTANKDFNHEKPIELGLQDVVAEPTCMMIEENPREWQIVLRIKHSQNTESNSPYFFMIELVGFFGIDDSVPDDKIEEFAKVNGSSVLYSTGREVLRSTMSMGPFLPIVLPTVCFYDPKPKAKRAACAQKKKVEKKVAAKAAPVKKAVRKHAPARKTTGPRKG